MADEGEGIRFRVDDTDERGVPNEDNAEEDDDEGDDEDDDEDDDEGEGDPPWRRLIRYFRVLTILMYINILQ